MNLQAETARAAALPTVQIGSAVLTWDQAHAMMAEAKATYLRLMSDEVHAEHVALYNAILRADKISKGIKVGPVLRSARIDAATARIEAVVSVQDRRAA